MGKKLTISQPMMLNVIVAPMIEMFNIEASDTTEQWYYVNTNTFSPHRPTDPLVLTPVLKAQDPDSKVVYEPSQYLVTWWVHNPSNNTYTQITNTTDGTGVDYVIQNDGSLKVKKNVATDSPVTLMCEYQYTDPRDGSTSDKLRKTVQLVTNRNSSTDIPSIEILAPHVTHYRPIADASSLKTFNARVILGGSDITSTSTIRWYAYTDDDTTERLIDEESNGIQTFLAYSASNQPTGKGQGTDTIVLDAAYSEKLYVVARVIDTSVSPNVAYPSKSVKRLEWDYVKVDISAVSDEGSGVRSDTTSKTFKAMGNIKGRTLTDAEIRENLLLDWKFRKSSKTASGTTPTDTIRSLGVGPEVTIDGNTLRQYPSSLVYADVYMRGAKKTMTQGGKVLTQVINGTTYIMSERT